MNKNWTRIAVEWIEETQEKGGYATYTADPDPCD